MEVSYPLLVSIIVFKVRAIEMLDQLIHEKRLILSPIIEIGINYNILSPESGLLGDDISTILNSVANLADAVAIHPK